MTAQTVANHAQNSAQNETSLIKKQRVLALDGIRGLAIIAVVLYHLRPAILRGGFIGVTVFFVLSGFLITRSVMRSIAEGNFSYSRYLRKRISRLWGPVFITITFSALIVYLFSPSLLPKLQSDVLPAATFMSNWSYIFRQVPYFAAAGLPSPLTHLWFLGVLAQFYLVWPLILLLLNKVKRYSPQIIFAAALLSTILLAIYRLAAADTTRAYYGLDGRLAELLVGALAAVVYPRLLEQTNSSSELAGSSKLASRVEKWIFNSKIAGLPALFLLLLLAYFTDGQSAVFYVGGFLATAVITAFLICAAHARNAFVNLALESRILRYIGLRSFAIYLVHYPLLLILNPATRTVTATWWQQLIQLAIVGVCGEIFYRLVEHPSGSFITTIFTLNTKINRAGREKVGISHKIYAVLLLVSVLGATVLAFAPLNWQQVANARAQALRPELTQTAPPAPGPASNQNSSPTESSKEQAPGGTPAAKLTPVAKKVPANLDTSSWKLDSATGTCSANALIIGDSVTLGATPALQALLPQAVIDGAVSRQFTQGAEIFSNHQPTGSKPPVAIFALGSNGLIRSESQVQSLVDTMGGGPVYFITNRTPYPLQDANNEILNRYAQNHPNVGIIDWWALTEGHSEYVVDDGTHTTPQGAAAFAELIKQALCG